MKAFSSIAILIIFALSSNNCFCQGCSDAGFCTVNTFQPVDSDTTPLFRNQIKAGINNGIADHDISVFGTYLEYNREISKKISADIKLTGLSLTGNDLENKGLSDVLVNINYKHGKKIRLAMGVKIPLTNGNDKEQGIPLPMDYQTSLGTLDLLAGIGKTIGKFDVVAALQLPLVQNKNMFFSSLYPAESLLSTFHTTNNYKRSGDVLLRISYPVNFGETFRITPGVLPVFHLSNDKFTDINGKEMEIDGSAGLTLNATIYIDYFINTSNSVQLTFGAPLLVRDARPDGLTRSYVANLEYRFKF